ncbi:hypothetical protein D3C81_2108940 [compost metagenome]
MPVRQLLLQAFKFFVNGGGLRSARIRDAGRVPIASRDFLLGFPVQDFLFHPLETSSRCAAFDTAAEVRPFCFGFDLGFAGPGG